MICFGLSLVVCYGEERRGVHLGVDLPEIHLVFVRIESSQQT